MSDNRILKTFNLKRIVACTWTDVPNCDMKKEV